MSHYRKKPVVIEAFQWDGTIASYDAINRWAGSEPRGEGTHRDRVQQGLGADTFNLVIATPEGDMRATKGDWIIKGVRGEFYPCKPDIFAETYEPANLGSGTGKDDAAALPSPAPDCPDCGGHGWYATGDTDHPEQVQCQRCAGMGSLAVDHPARQPTPDPEVKEWDWPVAIAETLLEQWREGRPVDDGLAANTMRDLVRLVQAGAPKTQLSCNCWTICHRHGRGAIQYHDEGEFPQISGYFCALCEREGRAAPPTPEPESDPIRKTLTSNLTRLYLSDEAAPPDEAKALEAARGVIETGGSLEDVCRAYAAALSAPPRTGPSGEAVAAYKAIVEAGAVSSYDNTIRARLRAAYAVDFGAGAPERALSPQGIERVARATLEIWRTDGSQYDSYEDAVDGVIARVVASLTPRTEPNND